MFNKISIIGAGQVGSNLAFLLICKRLFKNIQLIDVQEDLAKGVCLDLEDTRYFFGSNQRISASNRLKDTAGSDIVVISAGKPRSPGMSRVDLIKTNASIVKQVASYIKRLSPDSIVVVITNPLDLMTYLVFKTTGFKRTKIIGLGSSLDSSRFANLIAKKILLDISSINPAVFGPHSKEMLVSSISNIRGFPVASFVNNANFLKIKQNTVNRGTRIVNFLKKGSARFGPAAACVNMLENIIYDRRAMTFASVYLKGEYKIKDLCLGVPVVVGKNGIEKILELGIPKKELKHLKALFLSLKNSLKFLQ